MNPEETPIGDFLTIPESPLSSPSDDCAPRTAEGDRLPLPELTKEGIREPLPILQTPPPETVKVTPETDDREKIRQEIAELATQKVNLEAEITVLEAQKQKLIAEQGGGIVPLLQQLIQDGLKELENRKQALQITIEQLEKRRDRLQSEMRGTFAGTSQEIAIRLQGFKEYLVGSLQDLAAAAEQLQLPEYQEPPVRPQGEPRREEEEIPNPKFAKQGFQEQRRQITSLLDQYRSQPDYYGPPWQLRRTFEPVHADRVQDWFFKQGGRGAIRTLGSRLQNILVASAAISVLRNGYGDRLKVLVLANTPERLGEWRRGLQDCLGISRSDFGPTRGIGLFETPEALVQKAERLLEDKQLPLIVIDETEEVINLALLQFPILLAFAPEPGQMSSYVF